MLALSFSLAFCFLAAAAVASSALARTRKSRAFRVIAFAAAITVLGRVTVASGLHFNVTPSMPLGIYRLAPLPKGEFSAEYLSLCARLLLPPGSGCVAGTSPTEDAQPTRNRS